jgi:hypothetical protein
MPLICCEEVEVVEEEEGRRGAQFIDSSEKSFSPLKMRV